MTVFFATKAQRQEEKNIKKFFVPLCLGGG
jgi:hypothetical protein